MCNKISCRIKIMMRIRSYLSQKQADSLFNACVISYFGYCPLIWMFCGKRAHRLIENTHFRALRTKLNYFNMPYEELQILSNCTDIHSQNLKQMLIEVYRSLHQVGPPLSWNSFQETTNNYNLRRGNLIKPPLARNNFATNSFNFRAILAWNNLTGKIKEAESLHVFKELIQNWNLLFL